MTVRDDGLYLAEQVRRLCEERPLGLPPWRGPQIRALHERASRYAGDHQLFYLSFLDGVRDLLDEDGDAVLARFARQAAGSESRVLADSPTTRDHLTHVTQVFLLGWVILNSCSKFRALGDEWRPYGWSVAERFDLLNRTWLYTSLLHDCAYSVELAKQARAHEVRVRALFGPAYDPAIGGGANAQECQRAAKPLWGRRAAIIDRPIPRSAERVLRKLEQYPDHGFMTGQALMAEARQQFSNRLQEVLEVAAASLACHNFRWQLDPHEKPLPEVVDWFSVDFFSEPLAALLTVTDEIQEWGRERADVALARERYPEQFLASSVALTALDVSDSGGLTIAASLQFRLFPEDREHKVRRANDRELGNAQTNRQYRNAFRPRKPDAKVFDLHLRINETVEDVPCLVARRSGWPMDGRRLSEPAPDFRAPSDRQAVHSVGGRTGVTIAATAAGDASIRTVGDAPIRVVVVAPGGAGKSTLLRALADCKRLGRHNVGTHYIEELDDDLADLFEVCAALRARTEQGDSDVLLLVDHLDRIVETPHEGYWIDQLEQLPSEPWLHVVGACRPEEFEAVVGHAIGDAFDRAEFLERVGPLMESADPVGRATSRGIESHLRGTPGALDEMGRVAMAMRKRRFLTRPRVQSGDVSFDGEPAVAHVAGKVRFVHDAVQDYLAARYLARELAAHVDDVEPRRVRVRALLDLPRDVFRLLLDVLTDSGQLTHEERRRAAGRLAHALPESSMLHWLVDLGRVAQAERVVPSFRRAFDDQPEAAVLGELLLGLLHYEQGLPSRLEGAHTRDQERRIIEASIAALARSLAMLGASWPSSSSDPNDRVPVSQAEVLTVYIADHLFSQLCRVAILDPDHAVAEHLRDVALESLRSVPEVDQRVLSPHRIVRRLREFAPDDPPAGAQRRLYDDVQEREGSVQDGVLTPLSFRLYQLAGHIGGTYLLLQSLDETSFRDALRWQDRAIARALRVVRAMEQPGITAERFGSLAHGRADAARHHSARVQLWARALYHGVVNADEGRYRVLEAEQAHDEAWRAARSALEPGERLASSHRQVLTDVALGKVLKKADARGGLSYEEAARELDNARKEADRENRKWAERTTGARESASEAYYDRRLGDLADLVVQFAR